MSANEFGREGHFQIVQTDAEQPWLVRWCKNYREIFRSSENYARRRGCLAAIRTLPGGAEWLGSYTPLEVDERTPPPAPPTIEPPFYAGTDIKGETFWHDHEYHWRQCYGGECTEGIPPAGTLVAGRFGRVEAPSSDLPPLDWNVE